MEFFILVGILTVITIVVCYEYYRQLQKTRKEYEDAKEVIGDIVLSFNRQLNQEAEKLNIVAYRVEGISSKSDNVKKYAEELGKKVGFFEAKVNFLISEEENNTKKVEEIAKELQELVTSQKQLTARISTIEERIKYPVTVSDVKLDTAIPIRKEKALAPLTETELSVLDMLASEGPKTAPEIKDRIKLSREHTARLMKKLYEEGYLDRDTSKTPFKYSVKEEMRKLLKRTESGTAQQH